MQKLTTILTFLITLLAALTACGDKDTSLDDTAADCICTEQYEPVCGDDGVTYSNSCFAECAGVTDYTDGEC